MGRFDAFMTKPKGNRRNIHLCSAKNRIRPHVSMIERAPDNERWKINPRNHFGHRISNPQDWPPEYHSHINEYRHNIPRALMVAWLWLQREMFVAPDPEQDGWFFITKRGERVKGTVDLQAMRKDDILPRKLLHPVIAQKVWSLFLRGDYDTAVFQAFKQVEITVRDTGGLSAYRPRR